MAEYSSGPVTPGMWKSPSSSWWPSAIHSRAVSVTSGRTTSSMSFSSPVMRASRAAAPAMAAFTWKAAVPAGQ